MTSIVRKILAVKKMAEEMNIDLTNFAYLPEVPIASPFPREFMVEEIMGIKVLKLISTPKKD
jgi:NurA-like 5'-3' nuclease